MKYEVSDRADICHAKTIQTLVSAARRFYNSSDPEQVPSLQTDVMKATLGCDFRSMYIQPLMLDWAQNKSESCLPFTRCTQQQPGMLGLVACLPSLRRACSAARAAVVKTTRFSFRQVAPLLRDDPRVKVIHLLRDPRGILRSRQVARMVGSPLVHQTREIQALCSTILQDWKVS